jgi:hypothetical protein
MKALATTRRPNVRIVVKDAEHCIAVWDDIVFEVWRGPATLLGSSQMIQTCEELLASGGNVSFFAILEPTSPPPTERVRATLAKWSREVVPRMEAAVVVAEGGGFRSAIVRAVCTALTLLAPHSVPFKFVTTVEEGLRLLMAPTPSRRRDRDQLYAIVSEVRGLLG